MGTSDFYGAADEGKAIATIERSFELGVTFLGSDRWRSKHGLKTRTEGVLRNVYLDRALL